MSEPDNTPSSEAENSMPWLWWAVWVMVAVCWLGLYTYDSPHWLSVGVGFISGGILACWAGDITGGKFIGSPPRNNSPE